MQLCPISEGGIFQKIDAIVTIWPTAFSSVADWKRIELFGMRCASNFGHLMEVLVKDREGERLECKLNGICFYD